MPTPVQAPAGPMPMMQPVAAKRTARFQPEQVRQASGPTTVRPGVAAKVAQAKGTPQDNSSRERFLRQLARGPQQAGVTKTQGSETITRRITLQEFRAFAAQSPRPHINRDGRGLAVVSGTISPTASGFILTPSGRSPAVVAVNSREGAFLVRNASGDGLAVTLIFDQSGEIRGYDLASYVRS
jgi:hypothetical protein